MAAFARRFDAVIFVSGRKSSNGKVLCEVCRAANARTYQVEEAAELRAEWFEGAESVGICGATSTPRWLMQRVADAIVAGRFGTGRTCPPDCTAASRAADLEKDFNQITDRYA